MLDDDCQLWIKTKYMNLFSFGEWIYRREDAITMFIQQTGAIGS